MKDFESIIKEARAVAIVAVAEVTPTPVTFSLAKGFSNESIPGTDETCREGVCGFAWIKISGRGNFAKYVKQAGIASKGVYGGLEIWSTNLNGYNGQSLERKEASMEAVSKVFTKYGIKHSVHSRMD